MKLFDSIETASKTIAAIGAICAATVGAHAWLRGLITRDQLKGTIEEAVTTALAERDRRLDSASSEVITLKEWSGRAADQIADHEHRISVLEGRAMIVDTRIPKGHK